MTASATALADLITDLLRHAAETPGTRLLILCPPQTGKTRTATRAVTRYLHDHPTQRIAYATYASTLAALQAGHVYKHTPTSSHNRLDMIVVDDPIRGREQADNPAHREMVWDWWNRSVLPLLAPRASVGIVMTPRHHDDLAGRLIAREGTTDHNGPWHVLRIPAFARTADPLGRPPGAPLRPLTLPPDDTSSHAAHWARARRNLDPSDWAALYQCQPLNPTPTAKDNQ